MPVRVFLSRYRSYDQCPSCQGTRFKPESLWYRIAGHSIAQVYALNVDQALRFFRTYAAEDLDAASQLILDEITNRLQYLMDVGLSYLTLDRQSRTLSGGEVQRVALASALGATLTQTLYVLDEPSIGLHPRDNRRLMRILRQLRERSNTVVVVEHDADIISGGDYLLELGPGAGDSGGEVIYFGPTADAAVSPTAQYLNGVKTIARPQQQCRQQSEKILNIVGAKANNLKGITVQIPLGRLVCLTGVSGSGKSTLAEEILYKALRRSKGDVSERPGSHERIDGAAQLSQVMLMDQKPIGRTPRANLLTYTKAMDPLRKLLAETEAAAALKLSASSFSFNVKGGRCETCKGDGFEKIEMQFLSDVFIACSACGGKRFMPTVLSVTYKGYNIHEILQLTVSEALRFFSDQPKIVMALTPLVRVGLDYLRLGQPISTFSGGEAQRLKLSRFFGRQKMSKTLFIFDEPTTGLHFEDIGKLLACLSALVDQGHSVLVIEHHLDLIRHADWVIDLGPEGGDKGGEVVMAGAPEQLTQCRHSHTGRFLKAYLTIIRDQRRRLSQSSAPSHSGAGVHTPGNVIPSVPQIQVMGAKAHNLKDINLAIAHNQLVVFSGVSGSGKSTLAFDILFAEGQRRYLESLTPYVRQYLRVLERPEVDLVNGLSPTVAIEQRISSAGRRSTVATLTEIYHYLRLLFARLGTALCIECRQPLTPLSTQQMIARVHHHSQHEAVLLLAPKISGRKGFHKDLLARSLKQGFTHARIDGVVTPLTQGMALSRYHSHSIDLVIGRWPPEEGSSASLSDLIDTALEAGEGTLLLTDLNGQQDQVLSTSGICPHCGVGVMVPEPRLFSFNSAIGACPECGGLGTITTAEPDRMPQVCDVCQGSRLRPEALAIQIQGRSIWDLVKLPAIEMLKDLERFKFTPAQTPIAVPVVSEIRSRLQLLCDLGLAYLSLDRSGDTLSGGESQRLRLAAQLGSNLVGVTYILDEPTIGLHPRDNRMLVQALGALRDRGNTIIVVEHDEETIRAADMIIDLGPGAGASGGQVVVAGTLAELRQSPISVTAACLDQHAREMTSRQRPTRNRPVLQVKGAAANNLKRIDVDLPLQRLVCITGVSGSGKSTLLKETIYRNLKANLSQKRPVPIHCQALLGWESIKRILEVDHSPIGKTSRSIPASYVGFLTEIRRLFAQTPQARMRGFSPGRFSFNLAEGRCPACKGQGQPKVEMSFLPHVHVPCDLCQGKRFNPDTLKILYKGRTIADVLEMTFAEALRFFGAVPSIAGPVNLVCSIGLGYLRLGQPSPTLSGGEAQRIKLARQLVKPPNGHTFYILDEPTTGLHLADTHLLIELLQHLVDQGHSVVLIEHNLEAIKAADHIIDLGPEGGAGGGRLVASGSPYDLLRYADRSHTARWLAEHLDDPEAAQ